MPDPLHIMFSVLALYLVTIWTSAGKPSKKTTSPAAPKNTPPSKSQPAQSPTSTDYFLALTAGLATAGALLTKPYGLILGIPIAYLLLRRHGLQVLGRPDLYYFGITALTPFLLWRYHINLHPEGMFGTDWLYNAGNIRFTGSFFRWLIFDRMNRLIFATGGFVLFMFGLARTRTRKEGWFYYLWLLGVAIFFIVIAKGNVTHDYYQLPLVPIGCIFMALGFEFLVMFGRGLKQRIVNFSLAITLVLLMIAFGWYETRGFFNINHWEIVRAGQAADRLLPPDAKVIAPYQADSAFLYQTNRYGWTVDQGLIPQFIQEGATHLVSVTFDDSTNSYAARCSIIQKTDEFIIIDLTQCREPNDQEFTPENPPTDDDVYL